MPNTLAALPRSQYATGFWLVSGKKPFLDFSAFCLVDLPKNDKRDDVPISGARLREIADDGRLVLDPKALVCLSGWVATRGGHG